MKVRQNLYIDRELSDALEALASRPGGNKSRLVNDAIAAWLARQGTKEIDDLFKGRLDRLSRELGLVRRDLYVVLESFALFVRFYLLVTAPLPDADTAAFAVGMDRFEQFLGQLARQVATGKRTFGRNDPEQES
jgi:predicted transcriptional regulator